MTDIHVIPGTEIPMTHNKLKWFNVTPQKLLLFRKYMLLMCGLLLVTAVVELYISGKFTLSIALDFILALAMLTFSTKCETLYLKLKIEQSLEEKMN